MRAEQIRNHLRKQPYVPIRVFLSDGSAYDVRHPEMAAVSRTELVIGLDPSEDELPERFAYCDPVHVTRIEPIDGSRPQRPGKT